MEVAGAAVGAGSSAVAVHVASRRWLSYVRHHHTHMKPWTLLDFGFTIAGLLAGVAMGIWTSLCFFYGHDGVLGQRIAAAFVIAGIILMQIVRWKAGQKKDDKPDV